MQLSALVSIALTDMSRCAANVPPIVGSLFSWKSLLTKRMTSEDCDNVSAYRWRRPCALYLSDCCFSKQNQLDAATWLRLRGGIRHGGNVSDDVLLVACAV